MIYTEKGVKTHDMTAQDMGGKTDFEWICEKAKAPQSTDATNADEADRFKRYKAYYFIPGEVQGNRGNDAVKSRSLLVLDFDDGGTDRDKFIKDLIAAFPNTRWIAYPSASYGLKDPTKVRYRVVIDLNRPYTDTEHLTLFNGAADAIGYVTDPNAKDWGRIMGLPVLNKNTTQDMIVTNDGEPLDVDKALADWAPEDDFDLDAEISDDVKRLYYDSQRGGSDVSDELAKVSPTQALQLIQNWTDKHRDKLQTEPEFVKVLYPLIAWWRANEISEAVVHGAMQILAMGNAAWAEDNERKLHAHLSSRVDPPRVSFLEFFTGKKTISTRAEFSDMPRWELVSEMEKDRREVLAYMNEDAGTGQAKKRLSPSSTARLLTRHLSMYRTNDDDGAAIYIYDPAAGIYKGRPIDLQRWVQTIEPTFDENLVKKVAYFLQIMVPVRETESNPMLVPVGNGIYDYESKTLLPFSAEHFFIAKAATNWNPHAADKIPEIVTDDGEKWTPDGFLKELACGNSEIVRLLLQVIADAVNGNYSRGQAIFLLGSRENLGANGSNGKGTYQELIRAIVGDDNVASMKVNNLDEHFAVSGLQGKTVNIGDDLQASTYIDDSSNFNSAVTGDVLYTDVKYGKPQAFRFKGAMIQSTNEMPRFHNKTGGTYRRMVIVPFNAHFEGSTDNPDIKNDYIKRQNVREWFLRVALGLGFFKRFDIPQASKDLLADFKLDNDPVRQFVQEQMNFDRAPFSEGSAKVSEIYDAYREWSYSNGFNKPVALPALMKGISGVLRETKTPRATITPAEWRQLENEEKTLGEVLKATEVEWQQDRRQINGKRERYLVAPLIEKIRWAIKTSKHVTGANRRKYEQAQREFIA